MLFNMRKVFIGFALVALLLSAGCGKAATSTESKQPEKQNEQSSAQVSKEESTVDEVVPQNSSSDEIPSVRESLRLPFALDDESNVTVYVQQVGSSEVFKLSPYQMMIALQTLRFTKPSPSTDWLEEEPSGPKAMIVISSGGKVYETSYYYEKNALSSSTDGPEGVGYLYAYDTQLSTILHKLLEPETAMGTAGAFYDAMAVESMPNDDMQTEEAVDWERLKVEGKDYLAWETELSKLKPQAETSFVGFEEELETMAMYDGGVLALNLAYVFTEPGYATPDGIEVGTTRDEVLKKLGAPNRELPDVWGYKIGDFTRFHLYFADDKVAAIMLTMPL